MSARTRELLGDVAAFLAVVVFLAVFVLGLVGFAVVT